MLLQEPLLGSRRLIIIERGGVSLHIVTERLQLGDDLLVVELNALSLELLGNFVDALLRHTDRSIAFFGTAPRAAGAAP